MTRQTSKQHGVSLVEVVLTLAISSLLIATVLAGRNSVRSQAQFSDGMERIKETILTTKSEANTGNNTTGTGTGTIAGVPSKTYLLLGESLLFDTAKPTTMQDANVLCYGPAAVKAGISCSTTLTSERTSRRNIASPWGIKYMGYTTATTTNMVQGNLTIVFGRDDQTGAFTGAWYPNVISAGKSRNEVFANKEEITLHFASSDGRNAIIVVNPAIGSVTRTIQ